MSGEDTSVAENYHHTPQGTLDSLYSKSVASRRAGAIFNAFSYPTKIDSEVVALFIASHTKPGDVVLDSFGGSGTTGIAARLCDQPTTRMVQMANELGLDTEWGPRDAVVYELSPLGALLTDVMCNPPDIDDFRSAAAQLVEGVAAATGWMYTAVDPEGLSGNIRYVIWTEILITECCRAEVSLWEAAVKLDPVVLSKVFPCPACGAEVQVRSCARATVDQIDPITQESVTQRRREPAKVYGRTGRRTWSRQPVDGDREMIARIESQSIPLSVPSTKIMWGDLHRSGYHMGIERFHHLYSRRNLLVLAEFWDRIGLFPEQVQPALRLLVLSYTASHSSLLTRVVAKKGQKDLVVSGAQSGVLYVSGLPVEKNVIEGVRRKVETFAQAFEQTARSRSVVQVVNRSSTELNLDQGSIDYVFTDPPFGDFIPYSEVNQVNEAWLGQLTERTNEAIVSPAQGKGVREYAQLMGKIFGEIARVLKPTGSMTVVFHASKPAIWEALGDSFRDNGFAIERTSILDKTQVSFKQVVHEGGTRGDALFLLRPTGQREGSQGSRVRVDAHELVAGLRGEGHEPEEELTPRRLYSRYVSACVSEGATVEFTAPEFYALVAETDSANRGVA